MASPQKPKILLLGKIDHIGEVVTPKATNRAEFLQECRDGKFDGARVAYRTFTSALVTGMIDQELVEALPKSLEFLAHCGSGYDQVDVAACSARSPPLRVSNVPTAVDDSTADVSMFLIIGALRNFNAGMQTLREGKWKGSPQPIALGHDPQGKVLGVLGMGGIGRNLKKKAEAFGMTVIYHNRKELSTELADGAKYVTFDELLGQSDVISLNLPLNRNTRHIISHAEFTKMKTGVIIVNTARGPVLDENALVAALVSGKVASAGLDVFEEEPKVHPGLMSNPNVVLIPHMGTWSVETQTGMEEWAISNVKQALETGTLRTPVPEQAKI